MVQNRQLALPSYLVALSLVVLPPLDQLIQVLPLRVGDARWRFGAFGLASNSLALPTLGILLALVTATVFEHRRFRRVIGIAALTVVLSLAAGLVLFALDVLQVRNGVTPQATRAFYAASASATIKSFLAMLSLTVLGIAAFRGSKNVAKPARKAGLIVPSRAPRVPSAAEPASLDVAGSDQGAPR